MDEREALARLVAWLDVLNPAPNSTAWATADRILAAGYRLPTTGEIAAERRGWEQGRDAAKEVARDHRPERPLASRCTAEAIERGISALTFPDQMQRDGLRPAEAATMDDYDRHRCRYCGEPRATLDYRRRCMDCGSDMPATVLAMHVDPDCWRLEYSHQPGMLTRRGNAIKAAIRILAAGYRLPTTGELDAERRGWEAAADALDHWGDQEDAAAVTGPEADVTVHRAREAAFYDAAARLRERRAPASPPPTTRPRPGGSDAD